MIKSRQEADEANDNAFRLESAGKHVDAIDLWRQVIEFDAAYDHGLAFEKLGNNLEAIRDVEGAAVAYRSALALSPFDLQRLRNFAIFLCESGNTREAFEMLLRAAAVERSDEDKISADTGTRLASLSTQLELRDGEMAAMLRAEERAVRKYDEENKSRTTSDGLLRGIIDALKERYGKGTDY